MSILSQRTNLKSLRYGKDRIGGGSSNQPYIKSPIPQTNSQLDRSGGVDFLLRGGTLTPSRALQDVSRLTQMFFDLKSPNGLLFTAKQNLLSRTGVKTQASGKLLNEGVYLPTSTILQAAGNAFGIHLNKQGIDPTKRTGPDAGANSLFDILGIRDPLGLPIYSERLPKIKDLRSNRLVQLKEEKLGVGETMSSTRIGGGLLRTVVKAVKQTLPSFLSSNQISTSPTEILSYSGGPGSTLGVGQTSIRRYSNTDQGITDSKIPGYKKKYYGITNFPKVTPEQTAKEGVFVLGKANRSNLYPKTDTNSGLNFSIAGNDIFKGKYYVLDSSTIFKKLTSELSSGTTQISDFRTELLPLQSAGVKKNILSKAPDYRTKNIENRVNLGDPGRRDKNVSSYAQGLGEALDKITAHPLYKSSNGNNGGDRNDLVKFRIGIIDNNNPDNKIHIHFRAFLDSMDDSYTAEWAGSKYMGRGEEFFRYNGFTRSVNLSWTVAAQSKEELIPMYQKLNFLASSLAPDYSDKGYMRGNLATLTVGGYFYEQPGIIRSITYSVPTESPWEIGINDQLGSKYGYDTSVKELPHIIKVTGFTFTPIHTFVPKLQKNDYNGTYANKDGTLLTDPNSAESKIVVSKFGKERYIALSTGVGVGEGVTTNNYDSSIENYTYGPTAQARRKSVAESNRLSNLSNQSRPALDTSLPSFTPPPLSI